MMNAAESAPPSATSQMAARWTRGERRPHPKSHSPEERRLQEEGRQALDRQRRAEHVAHEPRVGRPVHAELELLDQAGHHPHRDVDHQQGSEEARQAEIGLVALSVPGRLEQCDQEPEADRDRDEQEVVDARHAELDAGEVQLAHFTIGLLAVTLPTSWRWNGALRGRTWSIARTPRRVKRSMVEDHVVGRRRSTGQRPLRPDEGQVRRNDSTASTRRCWSGDSTSRACGRSPRYGPRPSVP